MASLLGGWLHGNEKERGRSEARVLRCLIPSDFKANGGSTVARGFFSTSQLLDAEFPEHTDEAVG